MLLVELVIQTWAFRSDTGVDIAPHIADRDQFKARSLLWKPSLWACGLYYLVYQGIEGPSYFFVFDSVLTVFQLPLRIGLYYSSYARDMPTQPQQHLHLRYSGLGWPSAATL